MTAKKTTLLTAGIIATKGKATPSAVAPTQKDNSGDRIAVTVRLEPNLYRELKMYGLENRKSNQDIFVDALKEYLRKDVRA